WDVGALLTAVAVLVIVHRRGLRFRSLGDRVGVTAFWAALVATGADFLLIGTRAARVAARSGGGQHDRAGRRGRRRLVAHRAGPRPGRPGGRRGRARCVVAV